MLTGVTNGGATTVAGVESEPIGKPRVVLEANQGGIDPNVISDEHSNISGTPNARTRLTLLYDPMTTVYEITLSARPEPPLSTGFVDKLHGSIVVRNTPAAKLGINNGSGFDKKA